MQQEFRDRNPTQVPSVLSSSRWGYCSQGQFFLASQDPSRRERSSLALSRMEGLAGDQHC